MRNDFFKHILLSGGSRQNRTELETETLPYTFNSNSYRLRNYRIYGNTVNGESVGNLVTEGEHAGEYCVPVTITNGTESKTNNIYLLEQIRKVGDHAEYIDYGEQKQHRVRKNLWSGVVEQGRVSQSGNYSNDTSRVRSKNVPLEPGTYTISANLLIRVVFAYNDDNKIGLCVNTLDGFYSCSFTVPTGANNISIGMMKKVDDVIVDITPSDFIWGQIEKGSEATTYEPYIENTDLDVTLPALPTLKGTNVLSVGTEVQPSKVYLQGKISESEIVSAEPVQTNVQSLQPLSLDENAELDVMPSDKNEFQTNDISEMPVEDENSIEEILETENLETTGDDENAE